VGILGSLQESGQNTAKPGNVPNWKRWNRGTKAQYVVVDGWENYQRMEKRERPGRADRRKTGVNTDDFGRFPQSFSKNTLDTK
jgi:hypothetical protein